MFKPPQIGSNPANPFYIAHTKATTFIEEAVTVELNSRKMPMARRLVARLFARKSKIKFTK